MKKKMYKLLSMGLSAAMLCSLPCIGGLGEVTAISVRAEEYVSPSALDASLQEVLKKERVQALIYMTETCPVYGDDFTTLLAKLSSGTTVEIKGFALHGDTLYYKVSFGQEDVECLGYVQADFLISSNASFMEWQAEVLAGVPILTNEAAVNAGEPAVTLVIDPKSPLAGYAYAITTDILQFPESYQRPLARIKDAHPNWVFVPFHTGLYFDYVVGEEAKVGSGGPQSLVYYTLGDEWKEKRYSEKWYVASEKGVRYTLDPRNYLNEGYIFAFEQLTYNEKYHSRDSVALVLKDTFMEGEIPGEGVSYTDAFYTIGTQLGVSPLHLASRAYQEQGKGTSPLISGSYPGYEGYYNYYNIKASGGNDTQVITSGLKYAKEQGWSSRYASLEGGASFIASSYILRGQDTLYLQKFDVDNSYHGICKHQYMQNILAPMSESITTRNGYQENGALDNTFVFKIPVYLGMPEEVCGNPSGDTPYDDSENTYYYVDSEKPLQVDEQQAMMIHSFVLRLYDNVLGRSSRYGNAPSESEVEYWTNALISGEEDGANVAQGFFFSNEFKKKNVNNQTYVSLLYQVLMDRSGDQEGIDYWVSTLEDGMSRESVLAGFTASKEFERICKDFGIHRGSYTTSFYRDKNQGVTGFINRMYVKVLGRPGEEGGLEYWTKELLEKTQTAEAAAQGFVFSNEYTKKNTTNEEYITTLYQAFMDREPDKGGFDYWLEEMKKGANRETVFLGFSRSNEFAAIKEAYGVN